MVVSFIPLPIFLFFFLLGFEVALAFPLPLLGYTSSSVSLSFVHILSVVVLYGGSSVCPSRAWGLNSHRLIEHVESRDFHLITSPPILDVNQYFSHLDAVLRHLFFITLAPRTLLVYLALQIIQGKWLPSVFFRPVEWISPWIFLSSRHFLSLILSLSLKRQFTVSFTHKITNLFDISTR